VDALELLADADHAVLGVRNHAHQELAGVQLDGQLFTRGVHKLDRPCKDTASAAAADVTAYGTDDAEKLRG
jgi:hypothetical protein